MKAFEYSAPTSVADAQQALTGAGSACALAGGTDLINRMKDYVTSPDRVVYVKNIKDLGGVQLKFPPGGAHPEGPSAELGGNALLAEIVASKDVKDYYPALWQATYEVGTPQIRNMATIGGNLCQRPRCWFYRTGAGLLGMKNGKSLVRAGDNRYHAIFMTDGDALFVAPSSLAVPLIALNAQVNIASSGGKVRTIGVEELYRVPKSDHESELTLQPGEIITQVVIPPPPGANASYEVRQKQAHDWPLALCSVALAMDGDSVKSARVVLGAVAPVPLRCGPAEQAIVGKPLSLETAEAAAAAAVASAKPLSMNGYKVGLTKTAVKRALMAAGGKRYWEEA